MLQKENPKLHKLLTNDYLVYNCISYLKPKDLSNVSMTSKKLHKLAKKFNFYWLRECQEVFCSSYYNTSSFLWKENLNLGLLIHQNYSNFSSTCFDQSWQIAEEVNTLRTELYSRLKEYISLPCLRKENPYLESDLNTSYQAFLYDFLFEQQSLYTYYNSQFMLSDQTVDSSNNQNKNVQVTLKPLEDLKITLKNNKKLFGDLLAGISKIIKDIIERNLENAILSIKNYSLDMENYKSSQLFEPGVDRMSINKIITNKEERKSHRKTDFYLENESIDKVCSEATSLSFREEELLTTSNSSILQSKSCINHHSNCRINDNLKNFSFNNYESKIGLKTDNLFLSSVETNKSINSISQVDSLNKSISINSIPHIKSNLTSKTLVTYEDNQELTEHKNNSIYLNPQELNLQTPDTSTINGFSTQNSGRKNYIIKYKNKIPLEKEIICNSQKSSNPLIFILNSIILTVTHFCRTSFHIVNSIRGAEAKVILNEYYKRYKAFVDCACSLNSDLENVNVLTNYTCYYIGNKRENRLHTHSSLNKVFIAEDSQKFSIFKLFMITWNQEVLLKLVNRNDHSILVEYFGELFRTEILYELLSKLKTTLLNAHDLQSDSQSIIIKDFLNSNLLLSHQEITIGEFIDQHVDDNSLCFLENLLNVLVDTSVDEVSVYLTNHSELFSCNNIVNEIIEKLISINREVLEFHIPYLNSLLNKQTPDSDLFSQTRLLQEFINVSREVYSYNMRMFPFIKKKIINNLIDESVSMLVKEICCCNILCSINSLFKCQTSSYIVEPISITESKYSNYQSSINTFSREASGINYATNTTSDSKCDLYKEFSTNQSNFLINGNSIKDNHISTESTLLENSFRSIEHPGALDSINKNFVEIKFFLQNSLIEFIYKEIITEISYKVISEITKINVPVAEILEYLRDWKQALLDQEMNLDYQIEKELKRKNIPNFFGDKKDYFSFFWRIKQPEFLSYYYK